MNRAATAALVAFAVVAIGTIVVVGYFAGQAVVLMLEAVTKK